eukprot:7018884-Lingulodinium_polyedra.AAC.1
MPAPAAAAAQTREAEAGGATIMLCSGKSSRLGDDAVTTDGMTMTEDFFRHAEHGSRDQEIDGGQEVDKGEKREAIRRAGLRAENCLRAIRAEPRARA